MDRRTDYKTALLIDAAIKTPASGGGSPARVMAHMGVPFDVARRVLMQPDERRHPLPAPEFKREA
jgi:hypothetical protein